MVAIHGIYTNGIISTEVAPCKGFGGQASTPTRRKMTFDDMINWSLTTKKRMHQQLLEHLQSSSYNRAVGKMIPALHCRLGLGAVVLTLQRHFLTFLDNYRKKQLRAQWPGRSNSVDTKPKSNEEIKLMVNRFVGFGIAGLIEMLTKKHGDDDELHDRLALVRSIASSTHKS